MKTLSVVFPSDVFIAQPVPRSALSSFVDHMVEIQSIWLEEEFSTADAIARNDCWQHMQAVAQMLPNNDSPAVTGFSLDKLGNDYDQLEKLFFGEPSKAVSKTEGTVAEFDLSLFQGCKLYELHRFNPKKKLMDADRSRLERLQKKTSDQKTSPSIAAATKTPTRSPTSSKGSVQKAA